MSGRRLVLVALMSVMSVGCSSEGLLITIDAEAPVESAMSSVRVAMAGVDLMSVDGSTSPAEVQCFTREDFPLVLLLHPGQTYDSTAALRVEVWGASERMFIHEELLAFEGETRFESTITLSMSCRACGGLFCLGRAECLETSPTGAFGISPDDFTSSCLP